MRVRAGSGSPWLMMTKLLFGMIRDIWKKLLVTQYLMSWNCKLASDENTTFYYTYLPKQGYTNLDLLYIYIKFLNMNKNSRTVKALSLASSHFSELEHFQLFSFICRQPSRCLSLHSQVSVLWSLSSRGHSSCRNSHICIS